ncbi:MAG: hypothetical protein ABI091_19050 [Ferruginibacter sp.]
MKANKNNKPKSKKIKPSKHEYRLSPEWLQISEFFEVFYEEGPAEDLWKMLKLALVTDNDLTTPRDRSNMLFLYEGCSALFKNVYKLLLQRKQLLNK